MNADWLKTIQAGYDFPGDAIYLGAGMHEGICAKEAAVQLPLAMMTRHGLIAGATGTGKTKTLQGLAEQLAERGVPVFLADIKGDLSGLIEPGVENPKITQRAADLGLKWAGSGFPCEFYSLTGERGAQLRATISSFGPILLARALGLSDVQSSALAMVFKFCDDHGLLLLDLKDLRAALTYLTGDGKAALKEYGLLSIQTAGVLLREIMQLEQQGGEKFFGEPELELEDLLRRGADGRGIISVLELADLQDRPALFSTFMMWLLAKLYHELPEVGDVEKPKLVFFLDEAHLLFNDASKEFLDHVQQIVRLIRSKGVGVFFITQSPKDVPEAVLAQLGNRVQHALRAFTPNDQKALKLAAQTFPITKYYDLEEALTTLGIGEAIITTLNDRGVPTPVVWTRMVPPRSVMGPASDAGFQSVLRSSPLGRRYAQAIDRESAYEKLTARHAQQDAPAPGGTLADEAGRFRKLPPPSAHPSSRAPAGTVDRAGGWLMKEAGRQVGRALIRGMVGALFGRRRR